MKNSWLLLLFLLAHIQAQNVGINEASPHPKALLELQANDRGLRVTQLTTAERNTMMSGLTTADSVELQGLVIFNTTTQCLEYFNRYDWINMCSNTPPCSDVPAPVAGSNSPVCTGGTLNLTATPVASATYEWTGPNNFFSTSQNPSITGTTVAHAGTYAVVAKRGNCYSPTSTVTVSFEPICTGSNLISNPGFSSGLTGYTTDYTLDASPPVDAARYAITTNPFAVHSSWCNMADHTGAGNMLVANGGATVMNLVCQSVSSLSPNTRYNFSFWAASVYNNADIPVFEVTIGGTVVSACGSFTLSTDCNWLFYNTFYTTGPAETSLNICIRNVTTFAGGNDFGIDDLSLIACP